MDNIKGVVVLAWKWLTRPAIGKAGLLLITGGLALLNPPLLVEIANLILSRLINSSLSPMNAQPLFGGVLITVGLLLVLTGYFGSRRSKPSEVIGIRHQSLGSFPKEAIKGDLPLLQCIRHYRELDVNHSDSYTNGVLTDQLSLIRRMNKVPVELDSLAGADSDTPIAYYGLAHIPIAFYLGFLLADSKYNIQLYDLNNDSGRWNQLSGVTASLAINNTKNLLNATEAVGDIILSIGISYPVAQIEIEALNLPNVLGFIQINAAFPRRQLVSSHAHIEQICTEFKAALEHIKNCCPNRQRIHLFYAGPVSLCFALGRCLSERIDSEIVVYNYSVKEQPKYSWSLSLNGSANSIIVFNHSSEKGSSHVTV